MVVLRVRDSSIWRRKSTLFFANGLTVCREEGGKAPPLHTRTTEEEEGQILSARGIKVGCSFPFTHTHCHFPHFLGPFTQEIAPCWFQEAKSPALIHFFHFIPPASKFRRFFFCSCITRCLGRYLLYSRHSVVAGRLSFTRKKLPKSNTYYN